jgi:hypothetical protein
MSGLSYQNALTRLRNGPQQGATWIIATLDRVGWRVTAGY